MLNEFQVYQIAKQYFWRCKELKISYFLQDQLLRASSSIVLNLAEGSGRQTPADQKRFYGVALGSLRECQAIVALERIEDVELIQLSDQLAAMLFTLARGKARPKPKPN